MKNQDQPLYSMHDGKKEFSFQAPTSWQALTQAQLRYVLSLLATFQDHTVCKVYIFIRLCGIQVLKKTRTGWKCQVTCAVAPPTPSRNPRSKRSRPKSRPEVFYITDDEVLSLAGNFDFIDDFTEYHPLESVSGLHCVGRLLRDVTFLDYLTMEKYYQLFMLDKRDEYLQKMGWLMYRTEKGESDKTVHFKPFELLNVFMWFSCVKAYFAVNFPHFFKPSKTGEGLKQTDLMPAMQAQIRALTDGDITKQQAVCDSLCWDALTELDNKAREAEEFKEKMKKS